ncbi:cilia- and flagella-associated protein 65-like [Watersipora subatra]|uniref:cilia- and flagella-associated protein 65-like n=1 Tax=Watersipora subatra TaxID=2589382 RepID=UPI00355C69BB
MPCAIETKTSKVNHHGIEASPVVTYQGWEPGKEYTKHIVLKNVKVKTQKLTYHSPSSRFFSTLYPKQITLSAGTSYSLPITFRPLEKNIYEDQIYFASKDCEFSIPIKAVLPVFDVKTPDQLTAKVCAVKDETQLSFTIQNRSELVTPYQWDVQEPFSIEPSSGVLQPHDNTKATLYFRPSAALVYECQAKCLHGTNLDSISTTVLHGTGKYPQLLIASSGRPYERYTEATVDFGQTPIGTQVTKTVEIINMAKVEAKCTVEHLASLSTVDVVFSCSATKAIVPPRDSVKIQIKYSPTNVNTSSIDYLQVNSISDVRSMSIKCVGHCTGPNVRLSKDVLDFSLTNVGESVTRVMELSNESAAVASYQFKIDCEESVFKFSDTVGVLQAGESRKIIVIFCPTHPINYHRNISCVVSDQDPLFIDLLGTAHTETMKPAVLEPQHLSQFAVYVERGLSMFPPEQLNEMRANGKLQLDSNNLLMNTLAESIEPWLNPVATVPAMDLYFNDGYHSDIVHRQPHVSLDTVHADFGRCLDMKNIVPQVVRLTNHTKGKVIAQWMGGDSHTFHVTPNCVEIPPLKTIDFHVHFQPNAPNNFFSNELECFCYYKSTRDYRLVESLTHSPPFCLTLTAVASTFQPGQQTFLPLVDLSSPSLVFPATNQDEAAYRTLTLINKGSTPVVYDFSDVDTFSIKPKKGMMKSARETFIVKALPTRTKVYRRFLSLGINQDTKYTQEIPVTCTAETAQLLLSNNAEIFFKETCVGTSSSQRYRIKNISRVPLEFRWVIKSQDQPEHTFSFIPQELQRYVLKPTIVVTAQAHTKQQSAGKPRAFPVRAIGEGSSAEIKCDTTDIDFGNVLVGSSKSQVFDICNEGNCAAQFLLRVEQKVEGQTAGQHATKCALSLDVYSGEIPAWSKQTIRGTIKPLLRCKYSFEISYELVMPELSQQHTEPVHLVEVFACGVFPLMVITDARIHGSGIGIGKRQLWELFQLDNLNMFLDSDPSDRELQYSVQTRNSPRRRPSVYTRAILDFNFGAAPVDAEPCYVTLHVENSGTVDCEWEFMFPNDLQVDLECWSESGDYTQDELHEMKVMDNKLFNISPKSGKLKAGSTCSVTFTYHHLMPGTDRVPVLLKLSRGREIMINFVGVTVEEKIPYIHFPSNTHSFAPVAVGEKQCPKQLYELYNGGSVPVTFKIDCVPLSLLKSENFDHSVMECLNPKGIIAPGKTHLVEWMFYPLEAKTYQVDVPILISGGEPALITFTGVGYDKAQLGETMPTVCENNECSVPVTQRVTVPGQTVVLSHERVSFGNLPLFSKTRKVVFMSNTSDHTISYSWHVSNHGDEKMVNIYPAKGTLQSKHHQMVKVAFTSCGEPAFYDMDMVCEVVDETEMARYRRRLRDWENERERQINEFTITEKDLVKNKRARSTGEHTVKKGKPVKGGSAQNFLKIDKANVQEDIDLYKPQPREKTYKQYKALPPILDRSYDKDREEVLETERMKVAMWAKPVPPKPFLIHLGVIARTHSITSFQDQFFDDFDNFFIDKTLGSSVSDEEPLEETKTNAPATQLSCTEGEGEMLTGVIANVLRSLVDDPSFHQSVTKLASESTPYFSQFHQGVNLISDSPRDEQLKSGVDIVELKSDAPGSQGHKQVLRSVSQTQATELPAQTKEKSRSKTRPTNATSSISKQPSQPPSSDALIRNPSFANLVEDVLENTLMNILLEAANGEVNITARPRLIALPPRKGTPTREHKH